MQLHKSTRSQSAQGCRTGTLRAFCSKARSIFTKAPYTQVKETRETCSDLWSDLKTLKEHPKVVTWCEHINNKIENEHPKMARVTKSLHPPYLALAAVTIIGVGIFFVGLGALKHSQHMRSQEIVREGSFEIKLLRMEQKDEAGEAWRDEQQQFKRALKALEQSRSTGAANLTLEGSWS